MHVKHTLASWLKAYRYMILGAALVLFTLVMVMLAARRYYRTHPSPAWVKYYLSVFKGQWPLARALLYRKVRKTSGSLEIANTMPEHLQTKSLQVQAGGVNRMVMSTLWQNVKRKVKRKRMIPKALPELDCIKK